MTLGWISNSVGSIVGSTVDGDNVRTRIGASVGRPERRVGRFTGDGIGALNGVLVGTVFCTINVKVKLPNISSLKPCATAVTV